MNRKICLGCNVEKSFSEFHKQENGLHGLRSKCKSCTYEYRKVYTATPEFKERHRKQMIEYRKLHPIKTKRINKKCRDRHKERFNLQRKERYWNDPEYRQKRIEHEKWYKSTGRRQKMQKRLYKANQFEILIYRQLYQLGHPEMIKEKYKEYRKKIQNKKEQVLRDNIDDTYCIAVIKKDFNYKIKTEQIPNDLIKIKRLQILTHRNLKPQIK